MHIPFFDLSRQHAYLKKTVLQEFELICEKAIFSGGKPIEQFEQLFAAYCQTDFAIALNNGTSALHLALLCLGVGQGDEVIIPANTFIAAAWAATYCGATPIFVDCTPDTWQIDTTKIEEKITPKTKAIIGVHLYGQPFDVDAVMEIAQKHKIFVIEDAAHAHGALYKGKKVGSLSEMGCFSFYPTKNLGAYGEAGGITTHQEKYANHLQRLRFHGTSQAYHHDEIGFNMRMGVLEATSLSIKLSYLDAWNSRRKQIAHYYQTEIHNPEIHFQKQVLYADSVYHLFVITIPNREDYQTYLQQKGIATGLHYPIPCHLQKAYTHLGYRKGDFPHAEYLSSHCLSLPIFPELTDNEVEYIVNILNTKK